MFVMICCHEVASWRPSSAAGPASSQKPSATLSVTGLACIQSSRLQEACRAAIESAVQREQDAALLVQMLMGRLKLGDQVLLTCVKMC